MKFDNLVESFINGLVNEGRTSNISKYSYINVDADKMLNKLHSGDFDILIKSWAGSPRYAGLSEEELNDVMADVTSEISEMKPDSFDDLRSTIFNAVDKVYQNKGARRKTYDERLTKAITNLIIHKEYGLISTEKPEDYEEDGQGKEKAEYDIEGLSPAESDIYEFIKQADEPTSTVEIQQQFPNSQDIVDSLISKGFIEKEGNIFSVKEKEGADLTMEPEEDFEENPLEADEDVASTFKSTFGRNNEEDEDAGYLPSWKRGRGESFDDFNVD